MRLAPLLALAAVAGCSGTAHPGSECRSPPVPPVASHAPPPPPPPEASCLGSSLLGWAGKTRLLIGLSAGDAAAGAAPYDLRYQYLAGKLPPSGGCTTCGAGAGCDSSWWGCWQENGVPPGLFVGRFIDAAARNGQLPMFTYYLVLPASGLAEGTAEVAAVDDASFLRRYLADWKFLLQQIGSRRALLHLEPDFWGYAAHLGGDPGAIPAQVRAASAECGAQPDTLAGLAGCMIALARTYAPNARVGLHASAWAPTFDCFTNRLASVDCAAEGGRAGAWLKAAGADQGDFVVGDPGDRDADYYRLVHGQDRWWGTGPALPDFAQAFRWTRALAEAVGRPVLWWQVPLGNSGQGDSANHWKDNRAEYLFGHLAEAAAAHVVGIAFGAGQGDQTTPETDCGFLAASAAAYVAGGGTAPCP